LNYLPKKVGQNVERPTSYQLDWCPVECADDAGSQPRICSVERHAAGERRELALGHVRPPPPSKEAEVLSVVAEVAVEPPKHRKQQKQK